MSIVLFQYNFNYEIGGKTDLSCGLNLVTPDTEYIKKKIESIHIDMCPDGQKQLNLIILLSSKGF